MSNTTVNYPLLNVVGAGSPFFSTIALHTSVLQCRRNAGSAADQIRIWMIGLAEYVLILHAIFIVNAKNKAWWTNFTGNFLFGHGFGVSPSRPTTDILDAIPYFELYGSTLFMGIHPVLTTLAAGCCIVVK